MTERPTATTAWERMPMLTLDDQRERAATRHTRRGIAMGFARAIKLLVSAAPREAGLVLGLQVTAAVCTALELLVLRSLSEKVVSASSAGASLASAAPVFVAFAALLIIGNVAAAAWQERQPVLGEQAARHTESTILDVAVSVPLVDYEEPHFHDRLLRARGATSGRPTQLSTGALTILSVTITLIAILVALVALEPLLLGVVAAVYVPSRWVTVRNSVDARATQVAMTARDRQRHYLYGVLTDRAAAKEIRAHRSAPPLLRRFARLWDDRLSRVQAVANRRTFRAAVADILASVAIVVSLFLVGLLVSTGHIEIADGFVLAMALQRLSAGLRQIRGAVGMMFEGLLFLEDYFDLLDNASTAATFTTAGHQPAEPLRELCANSISHRYPGTEQDAITDISLSLRPGEIVALVGPNGAGKTTLAKVLAGLYEPRAGTVTWNGVPYVDIDHTQLTSRIAVVFQDFVRYELPALENIGLGAPEKGFDAEEIRAAASLADVDELICSWPEGYETVLSPAYANGRDLSSGQWQRIAMARGLLRDADLVILDEPTGPLDPAAERALVHSLRTFGPGRALLVISHRFATVRDADRVYVLDDGGLVAEGTHEVLLVTSPLYADLYGSAVASESSPSATTVGP